MSSEPGATSSEPDGLQFDHAEFENVEAPAAVACAACGKPILDRYFEINGTVVCEPCRQSIEAQIRGGSKLGRFGRAVLFGSGAALVGIIVYTTFKVLSPMDISLVAILVGFIVGKMVRKGSRNLGGLAYQLLAMFLTYTSLSITYLLVIMIKSGEIHKFSNPLGYLMALVVSYGVPVLMMKESPILIAFVGFALWEAWKFNAPLQINFTGPYQVGDPGPVLEGVPGHA